MLTGRPRRGTLRTGVESTSPVGTRESRSIYLRGGDVGRRVGVRGIFLVRKENRGVKLNPCSRA